MPENYYNRNTYEDLKNSSYASGMHQLWENDSYLSFNIKFDNTDYSVLYLKKEDKPFYSTGGGLYDDMTYCFPNFQEVNNDFAIGFRSMDEIHSQYTSAKVRLKESRENTIVEEIVKKTSEEDNPVLFIFYFKK